MTWVLRRIAFVVAVSVAAGVVSGTAGYLAAWLLGTEQRYSFPVEITGDVFGFLVLSIGYSWMLGLWRADDPAGDR